MYNYRVLQKMNTMPIHLYTNSNFLAYHRTRLSTYHSLHKFHSLVSDPVDSGWYIHHIS